VAARGALAKELKRACIDVGFFYGPVPTQEPYQRSRLTGLYLFCSVKNHGIPEESIEAVISASKRFFSLPGEEKLKVLVVFIF
jgi:isopenicillin N synthase-like dioxygenase